MFHFLQNLDNDIRDDLLAQLHNLWTHTFTAIYTYIPHIVFFACYPTINCAFVP